jgi:hypothetical protein
MTLYWGVDSSAYRANSELSRGRDSRARRLFEYVADEVQAPSFWGRYLTPGRNQLHPDERDYLGQRGCRILPIYNVPRASLAGATAEAAGRQAANDACTLARSFGIPSGVRIYADLERWRVDPAWFRGWCATMYASEYAGMGGVYGNPAVPNRATEGWGGRVDAGTSAASSDLWPEFIRNLAAGRRVSKPANLYIWSNRPLLGTPRTDLPASRVVPRSFDASRPVTLAPLADTVVWQYHMNTHLGSGHAAGSHGIVDLDLATERGYAEMWAVR